MRTIRQTLQDHDLGHLRILAELWGLDLPSGTVKEVAQALSVQLLETRLFTEIVESLPENTYLALEEIINHGGRVPFAEFVVQYGPFREMGPGRRDREKPWRKPTSPIEALWYRGLIGRAFADSPQGPLEFAFIPSDLIGLLPRSGEGEPTPLGQPADQPPIIEIATSIVVDDATTVLAALRRSHSGQFNRPSIHSDEIRDHLQQPASLELIPVLLGEEGIVLDPDDKLVTEQVKLFLDAPREEALRRLLFAWQRSTKWNDLEHTPNLTYAKPLWPNDPLVTRQGMLELLKGIPLGDWWDFNLFLEDVRTSHPGFLRPTGDFDSWFLQDAHTGAFLDGITHWNAVEGALLHFMLSGPLHWLGAADLGKTNGDQSITCFRLTPAAAILSDPKSSLTIKATTKTATVHRDGQISIPRGAVRALRYQIARFTTWEPMDEENYHYRLTPRMLDSAKQQGLQVEHIRQILSDATSGSLPKSLLNALDRWSKRGTEASINHVFVLRAKNPSVIEELQKTKTTSRYLEQTLSPTAVIVSERNLENLCREATRLGILIDPPHREPFDIQ